MKEELLDILSRVGFPYKNVSTQDGKRIAEIHKYYFKRPDNYYKERLGRSCSSCMLGFLNDLINRLGIKSPMEKISVQESMYQKRIKTCLDCTGHRKKGSIITCGEFLKPTKGRYPTCGCVINVKAKFKVFNCPRGKWKDL